MASALSYMAEQARQQDRDRFLCTLFATEDVREALFVLLAFNAEVAKSREVVSEALLGEIRVQWWRDAIGRIYSNPEGDFEDHLIVGELASIVSSHDLPRQHFDRLINGRSRDMIDEAPKDEAELLTYAADTASSLNVLMLKVVKLEGQTLADEILAAAEHIGVAWSLTGIIRASSIFAKYKRIFVPQSVMYKYGFDANDVMAQKITPEIKGGIEHILALARSEISAARKLLGGRVDKRYRSIFLQARLAELYLNRIEKFKFDVFSPKLEAGRAGRQILLTLKAVRGSF